MIKMSLLKSRKMILEPYMSVKSDRRCLLILCVTIHQIHNWISRSQFHIVLFLSVTAMLLFSYQIRFLKINRSLGLCHDNCHLDYYISDFILVAFAG